MLINSWVKSQVFFFEGAILIGPSSFFLEHWAFPNRNTSLDLSGKIKTNTLMFGPPFQFIYMNIELEANYMG
jgi:hypothetical protein